MKLLIKTALKPLLILIALFSLTAGTLAMAQDTVSTDDALFTTIPTKADTLKALKKKQDSIAQVKKDSLAKVVATKPKANDKKPQGLWGLFIAGFIQGLLAVVMPCIYPLLPLTVSFFTKKAGSRSKGIVHSMLYGLSIIVIYVSLGLIITLIFGSDALNSLASNGVFNIFFFLLLVAFGASFLGAFEITLPSSLANKLDESSDKGGLAGIFFMAATLVVVSFSCTGPLIGNLLVIAANSGDRVGPAMGMFGFSSALALPFTLFALFPSLLKSLPKSGGWLNSIKVVLGFLELAFALKFLSNVDLAYHWNWFDREIFLSLWIAIGLLIVLYLLGKIKFSHDSDLTSLSVPRTVIAIITLAFVVYMVPGLWGAPLKSISAFLPPEATQDFNLNPGPGGAVSQPTAGLPSAVTMPIGSKKYEGNYTRIKTRGLDAWYDYDQALQVSKALKKPILIDFTGFVCVNCRKMEADVWSDPKVFKKLREDFVLLQLVVDDKAALPESEWTTSKLTGKKLTTLGAKWSDLEADRFSANSQPLYVMLDSDGNLLKDASGNEIQPSPANYVVESYLKFLDSGIAAYKAAH